MNSFIPLKTFVINEAERRHVARKTIYNWLRQGRYPNVERQAKNRRVIDVRLRINANQTSNDP